MPGSWSCVLQLACHELPASGSVNLDVQPRFETRHQVHEFTLERSHFVVVLTDQSDARDVPCVSRGDTVPVNGYLAGGGAASVMP